MTVNGAGGSPGGGGGGVVCGGGGGGGGYGGAEQVQGDHQVDVAVVAAVLPLVLLELLLDRDADDPVGGQGLGLRLDLRHRLVPRRQVAAAELVQLLVAVAGGVEPVRVHHLVVLAAGDDVDDRGDRDHAAGV